MEGIAYWGTTNIKVASAVATYGGKPRPIDPASRTIKEDGSSQVTFWFEAGGKGAEVRAEMECPWSEMKCPEESPIRYIRASLENRETLLGLVKRAIPVRVIVRGGQTLLVSENATSEQKRAMLRHL
jgi:hypothetical protein